MKKLCISLSLVFAALLCGCRSQDSDAYDGNTAPVVRSNRSYFFDKDLRPAIAVPATSANRSKQAAQAKQSPSAATQAKQQAVPEAAPSETGATTDARKQVTSPGREVMAAQTAETQPSMTAVMPQRATATGTSMYEARTPRAGSELVAVNDAEASSLRIIYPREDAPVIQIDKAMPKEVRVGNAFSYTIKITNLTEAMLTDITITETISKDVQFTGADPVATTEGTKLTWQIDSLGPKASKMFKVSGVANVAKPLEHKTSITHTMSDCASLNVVQPALKLVREAPAEAILCEPIPVDFTVTNTGTGTAANVQIIDTLPSGLLAADGKDRVVLDAGNLMAGESRRFSVKIRASKTGAFTSKAVATSPAGFRGEAESSVTTVRQPVIQITRTGPQRQYLGRPTSYEITVLNKGDGSARDVVLEDMVPGGAIELEATSGAQFMNSKLVWELGTLQPTESKKVRVTYTPQNEGDVVVTTTATAYCAETVTSSTKLSVNGIASSRLEVVDLEDPIEAGSQTTYLVTVTNQGSAADTNVRINCILDDRVQYVTSAGTTPGTLMGKTLSFSPVRSIEPKSKVSWRIIVKGTTPGDVRFKVTMSSDKLVVPVEYTEVTHIYQP